MTTGERVCDWACENSCRFCFGNQCGHQTDPCTRGWAQETRRRQTRLSHTFHTHSFKETKAGKFWFAFTPRNTQNTHGPLVRPLKPADVFFVCTQIVPQTQMQPPPRRSLAQGQTQIHTYWSPSVLKNVKKCCRRAQRWMALCSIADI